MIVTIPQPPQPLSPYMIQHPQVSPPRPLMEMQSARALIQMLIPSISPGWQIMVVLVASDLCSNGVNWTNNDGPQNWSGTCPNTITITFTATDNCTNSSQTTATFTINDTTMPTITCPSNLVLECTTGANYVAQINAWLGTVIASDVCDGSLTITNSYDGSSVPALSCNQSSGLTITFTATDDCNNMATCTSTVYLDDNTVPTISCPPNLVLDCVNGADYVSQINTWIGTATAADGCDGSVTITTDYNGTSVPALSCTQSSGLVITFTATDDCNNTAQCTSTVYLDDNTIPAINCPTDLTLECGSGNYVAQVNAWIGTATASDGCDGNVTITTDFDPLSIFTVSCDGSSGIPVTFTATDDCGNTATCTKTVYLLDTQDPYFTNCPGAPIQLGCNPEVLPSGPGAIALVGATDDCNLASVIANVGSITGMCQLSQTITVIATDGCGHQAQCQVTYTWNSAPPLVAVCPPGPNLPPCTSAAAIQAAYDNWVAGFSYLGGCNVTTNIASIPPLGDLTCGGILVFLYKVDNAPGGCFGHDECIATFTVVMPANPMITCPATDLTLECSTNQDLTTANTTIADWLNSATASGGCGNVTITNTYSSTGYTDGCGATGSQVVTFTATDACSHTATCTATINIVDTTNPTINCPASDLTLECSTNQDLTTANTTIANWLNSATGSDGCGNVTITNNYISTEYSNLCGVTGSQVVTFTATDECEHTATCTATINIVDTTNPTITCPATDLTLECSTNQDLTTANTTIANWLNSATGSDGCGNVTITNNYSSTAYSNGCGATGSQVVTFTATDECGRTATCTATINIVDTTNPTINCPASDLTLECSSNQDLTTANTTIANWLNSATGSDGCGNVTITNTYSSTGYTDGCGATGSQVVTFTATDECGHTAACTATINIVDTTNPTINCPATDLTLECSTNQDLTTANTTIAELAEQCNRK